MNKLYYAVIGGLIMCLILLSFSNFFTERVALLNIIFLFVFGFLSGSLVAYLYFDFSWESEIDWHDKKVKVLEDKYYQQDQERLAYIHKLQISKDEIVSEYDQLKSEVADNLGLSKTETEILGVGGSD